MRAEGTSLRFSLLPPNLNSLRTSPSASAFVHVQTCPRAHRLAPLALWLDEVCKRQDLRELGTTAESSAPIKLMPTSSKSAYHRRTCHLSQNVRSFVGIPQKYLIALNPARYFDSLSCQTRISCQISGFSLLIRLVIWKFNTAKTIRTGRLVQIERMLMVVNTSYINMLQSVSRPRKLAVPESSFGNKCKDPVSISLPGGPGDRFRFWFRLALEA